MKNVDEVKIEKCECGCPFYEKQEKKFVCINCKKEK